MVRTPAHCLMQDSLTLQATYWLGLPFYIVGMTIAVIALAVLIVRLSCCCSGRVRSRFYP